MGSTLALHGLSMETDPLWSARLLHSNPSAIQRVHSDFLDAGAEILVSNSYQASVEGFVRHLGVSSEEALALIGNSVRLAQNAAQNTNKTDILVAGSVGPYGACQNDGSEYTGAHVSGMTDEQLMDWHRPRVKQIVQSGASLLAVETLPAVKEALAVLRLLREFPGTKAWITFSCKDGKHTNAGNDFGSAVQRCCSVGGDALVGVGVNCSCPSLVLPLLESLDGHPGVPPPDIMPRIVYPNSGEIWVAGKGWTSNPAPLEWPVEEWARRGARVIGGCCRVAPSDIKTIAQTVAKINLKNL
ncbi:homocysteine S-methyltransferase YbgG isoform X3 [Hyalella azteca]|nr:homocysteine S-methyltransferase YbgG isoform X3 [Hyalella azteca]